MTHPDPNPDEPRLRTVFLAALERPYGAEREAYLDAVCAGDEPFQRRVEVLIAQHTEETLLDQPTIVPVPATMAPGEESGMMVGRYKLLERLGEGGFGVVWMAEQDEPVRRRVALKIIKLGMDTREVVARFEAERQALAVMDHPGIARVFDGGATEHGRPFFVMELVQGVAITEYCEQNRLGIRERLQLLVQVCEAVQHAHQKGVIHRDLKPSNVLVAEVDGRAQPKVIDFGVAKATASRLTAKTVFTRFHQVIGTPAYMSPEQAGGTLEDIDTRADVYSLGVLLYELLTGRTPFDTTALLAVGFDAILRVIREDEPPLPSTRLGTLTREQLTEVAARRGAAPDRLGRLVQGELDWIVMRALEKDRQRRYPTAQGLAADLGHFLRNEPVNAAPPSAGYRLTKFIRRNRVAVGTGMAITLTLLAATAISLRLATIARRAGEAASAERDRARSAEREADLQREAAQRNAEESRQRLVRLSLGSGRLLEERGDVFGAALWYTDALARDSGTPSLPSDHRASLDAALRQGPVLVAMGFHDGGIRSGRFDPKGAHVLTAGDDGLARIWDALDGTSVGAAMRHAAAVRDATFNDDGTRVLTACEDGTARVWDAVTGRPASPPLVHRLPLKRVFFAAGGSLVVTASGRDASAGPTETTAVPQRSESELRAWDAWTGSEARATRWHHAEVRDLDVDPSGTWVMAGYADRSVVVANSQTWSQAEIRQAAGPSEDPWSLIQGYVSPPRSSPESAPATSGLTPLVDSLSFFAGGRRLFVSLSDGGVEVWGIGEPTRPSRSLLSAIRDGRRMRPGPGQPTVVGSPDGTLIACLEGSGTVRLWGVGSGAVTAQTASPHPGALGIAFSPDGRRVVTFGGGTGMPGAVRTWDTITGQPASPVLPHGGIVTSVTFDPDGGRLLVTGGDGSARLWELFGHHGAAKVTDHDTERLGRLASLLSARQLDDSGTLIPLPGGLARERWLDFRESGVLPGPASSQARHAWHEQEAAVAEANEHWFAAVHHLSRLVNGRPGDRELRSRLARARRRAALAALE